MFFSLLVPAPLGPAAQSPIMLGPKLLWYLFSIKAMSWYLSPCLFYNVSKILEEDVEVGVEVPNGFSLTFMHPVFISFVARPPRFLWSFPKNWTQRIPSPLSSEGIYNDKLDKLDRQPCHIPLWNAMYVFQKRHTCILDLKNLAWYAISGVKFVFCTSNYPRNRLFRLGSVTKVKFCWPVLSQQPLTFRTDVLLILFNNLLNNW